MRLAIVHTVTSLVPVLLRRAVTMGQRIGVLATLMSTMALTTDLIGRVASELGRVVEVKGQIVDGLSSVRAPGISLATTTSFAGLSST